MQSCGSVALTKSCSFLLSRLQFNCSEIFGEN
jgi:hypothetical protein